MADHAAIMLKFCESGDLAARQRKLEKWIGKNLAKAEPLFPEDKDEELSSLFAIYLHDSSEAKAIVKKLSKERDVEYAHEPAEREPRGKH